MISTDMLTTFCAGNAYRVLEAFSAGYIPYEGHRLIIYGETTDGLLFISEFIEEDPGDILPMEIFEDEYEAKFSASMLAENLGDAFCREYCKAAL